MLKVVGRTRFVSCSLNKSQQRFFSSSAEQRYLITGGQGFIGAWIVKHLLDENTSKNTKNKITILDHQKDEHILSQVLSPAQLSDSQSSSSSLHRTYGDIANPNYVHQTVANFKPHFIIHMAALQIPTCRGAPVQGAMVNVVGTVNVFEAARHLSDQFNQLPTIVYASSAAITGNPKNYGNDPILDNTPHIPLNHYGVFKIANEGTARVYWHDHKIPSVGLRPFTVYGVGREVGLTSAPTKAIKAAVLGRPYNINFSGDLCINYAEDLANIFVQCARAKLDGSYALNIKGEVVGISDWIRMIETAIPSAKGKITHNGGPLPFPVHFDEAGLATLLNQHPVRITPVMEGIKRTIQKFKELNANGTLGSADL